MHSKLPFAHPIPGNLSPASQKTLLDWIHTVGQIETESELKLYLDHLQSQLPTKHMVITLGRINQHQQLHRVEKVVNVSFPEDWVEHYMSHNYISCDPVLRSVMGQGPIHWADKFARAKGQQEKQFIQELASIGMGNGISFSALSERQNLVCVLSVSGSEIGKDSQLTEMLNSLLLHLRQAAGRVANLAPAAPAAMPLSQREFDIFHWMSHGKTNWEIATILGISERTVKFHVANIIRKLNANNRTHAIVIGLQLGLTTVAGTM